MNNVLLIGSGGREHAIAWSIYKDENIKDLYCAPGNAGTLNIATNVPLNIMDNNAILSFVNEKKIDFIIVGPEQPLENGIVDFFNEKNIKIFGPTKYASQLETSKLFARNIMEEYNIPQPAFFECKNEEEVISVKNKIGYPIVLKADGLAAGKGVIICKNDNELFLATEIMINKKKFGNAAKKISVEECIKGEELSVFAICDGENYQFINSAQDHKRIFNDDKGPNTGGMGAYSPTPLFTNELKEKVEESVLKPILYAMKEKGHPFIGFLYIGLMIIDDEPYVIEFNVRLGDPEAQVLLPLIQSSILKMMQDAVNGDIKKNLIKLSDEYAVTVVLAASGYPDSYNKNMLIEGLNETKNHLVFHAGTSFDNGKYYSNGGRVLNVVAKDSELNLAIRKAYQLLEKINFKDKYFRTDIGHKGLKYLDEKKIG